MDVVDAASRIREAAARAVSNGLEHAMCLAFAPSARMDGDLLTAALRKGVGAHIPLAGALTGDEFTFNRSRVFAEGGASSDRLVLAGVFSRRRVGITARHGCEPAGPLRTVTRCEGAWLVKLDDHPAIDVWLADIRATGATTPDDGRENVSVAVGRWQLGLDARDPQEPIVRAPMAVRPDGAVLLSAEVAEKATVRIMRSRPESLLRAGRDAVRLANKCLEPEGAAGALVLSCAVRLLACGSRFPEEPAGMSEILGAPVAGACVFGEIARGARDVDAFHNCTTVVVAWPRE
jgi:hypothetical protein